MYNIEVNKTTIQNHLQYDWWKYAIIILVAIITWNGVTNYKINKAIPEDERMEIFLVGDFIYDDTTENISSKILEDVEGLQKLDFINIPMYPLEEQKKRLQGLDPENKDSVDQENTDDVNETAKNSVPIDPQLDMAGQQKLMVMLGSQSGDIFIFETDRYKLYAEKGAFMALDDHMDKIKPLLNDDTISRLEGLKIKGEDDEKPHLYGVPADDIELFEGTGYDMEDKVLCITAYSKKPEKAWNVAEWLLTNGR